MQRGRFPVAAGRPSGTSPQSASSLPTSRALNPRIPPCNMLILDISKNTQTRLTAISNRHLVQLEIAASHAESTRSFFLIDPSCPYFAHTLSGGLDLARSNATERTPISNVYSMQLENAATPASSTKHPPLMCTSWDSARLSLSAIFREWTATGRRLRHASTLRYRDGVTRRDLRRSKEWSGIRESNPRLDLGKVAYYHYTNPARRLMRHNFYSMRPACGQEPRRDSMVRMFALGTTRMPIRGPAHAALKTISGMAILGSAVRDGAFAPSQQRTARLVHFGDACAFHHRRFSLALGKLFGALAVYINAGELFAVSVIDGDLPVLMFAALIARPFCGFGRSFLFHWLGPSVRLL
jgi:hypothetical protein